MTFAVTIGIEILIKQFFQRDFIPKIMEDHSSLLCLRTNSMIESVVQVISKKN